LTVNCAWKQTNTGSDVCAVLDLPQLYTRPSATALLETLALLTTAPPSWDLNDNETPAERKSRVAKQKEAQVNPEGVTRYLTSIISSSLKWIEDDEVKEEIWNQTSFRLSERSGRTAMGALSRKFRIPSESGSFELSIHEPALTGDDLGLKTWASSYILAKRLHKFDLASLGVGANPRVLELGSGTGLVGLAMAGLGADVVLTDLPSIHDNLARNAKDNCEAIEQSGGSTRTGILDWTNPASCQLFTDGSATETLHADTIKFPLILAADALYSPDHPRMLVDSIQTWLSHDSKAKVITEFPYRDAYLPEIRDFRQRMESIGLNILEEGEESGYDDWSGCGADDEDERTLVTCWWSHWGRAEKTT
jgi:predicted nicotinamide N-methyase